MNIVFSAQKGIVNNSPQYQVINLFVDLVERTDLGVVFGPSYNGDKGPLRFQQVLQVTEFLLEKETGKARQMLGHVNR